MDHKTWDLEPQPGQKLVKGTWVFKIKKDSEGNVTKFKARYCACGYSQILGLNYFHSYAPVAREDFNYYCGPKYVCS